MKLTAKQTQTKTIADLYRAIDHSRAVTITYTDRHGVTTIRTIEPYAFSTTEDGGIRVHAMCRLAHTEDPDDADRAFTITRISAYTVHRIAFVLDRPEPTVPTPAPRSAAALVAYELERSRIAAAYRSRAKLTQTDTDLAA